MKQVSFVAVFALCLPLWAQAQAPQDQDASAPAPAAAENSPPAEVTPAESTAATTAEPAAAETAGASDGSEPPATRFDAAAPAAADAAPAETSAPQSASEVGTIAVQSTEAPVANLPVPEDAPRELGDVVVTAQKTKQSARKVPVSITALDGESMKQNGSASLADVSLYVPNVRVDAHDPGSPQVFIRGFGTNAFNPSFESSVAFVQDDIYFGRPGYFTESMFDIERIEVLRGPQGTLFGKNTVAGVFNVISKGPEGDPAADLNYYRGNQNEQRIEGGAGGMLNDWFGARIAGYYQSKDGQLHNEYLNRSEDALTQRAGRLKLRLQPANGLTSELTASTSKTKAPFWPFQLMNLDGDTRSYLQAFDPNIEDNPYNFVTSFDTQGWIDKGSNTVSLKTDWNIGDLGGIHDFDPTLVLGWSKFHIDQLNELDVSPADIARLDSHERHRQISAELRFTGHADSLFGFGTGLEFVAGAFYFDSHYNLLARVLGGQDLPSYALTRDACLLIATGQGLPTDACDTVGTLGLPGLPALHAIGGPVINNDYYEFDYDQEIASQALFGQATWNLNEHWAVTPGVRFSKEKKSVHAMGSDHCAAKTALPFPLPGAPSPCLTAELISGVNYDEPGLERSEADVAPKLALQYFSDHGVNYYTSYAKGYKSGGFNAISLKGGELAYEPEEAQTYELGAKGRFFDNTLSVNLTLYQTHFSNLQVLAFKGLFFDVSNAGVARSRGLETDFLWLTPYAPLRLAGSGGLLNAIYLQYPGAPAPIQDGIGTKQDLAGKRIAFAPKSTGTLTPTLTYPLGEMLATFAADVIWQGNQYTDVNLGPNKFVGGYTKYAARLILANAEGKWSVSVGGTNLTDKRILNQVIDATFFPGAYFAQQAAGRQIFAMLAMKI